MSAEIVQAMTELSSKASELPRFGTKISENPDDPSRSLSSSREPHEIPKFDNVPSAEIVQASEKVPEIPRFRMEISENPDDPRSLSPLSREIPKFDNVPSCEDFPREKDENVNNVSEGVRRIPKENGAWTGEPGNSKWVPDKDYIPKVYNPDEEKWRDILEKYGIDGIDFNDGEPDFSTVAEETVEIDDYSEDRSDNYDAADEALANKWNTEAKDGKTDWTMEDIAKYRQDNKLSWHECNDMKTMQLVPREIHLNVPHAGGISMTKNS